VTPARPLLDTAPRTLASLGGAARKAVRGTLGPLLALGAFAGIAASVFGGEAAGFDRAVALAVHRLDSRPMEWAMQLLSLAGSAPVRLLVVAAVLAWAWRSRHRRAALILAGATAATEGLNAVLKLAFHRPRPSLFAVEALHSYSFPSDHAMGSLAIFGLCAAVVVRLRPSLLRPLLFATPALALLIGLSRISLGVHWPTDVLAGYAAGTFILLLGLRALKAARARA